MELNFIEEDIPKIARVGGAGREPEKWEEHVAPLKAEDRAGKSFRVWTYEKRPSATSRMSSVRERLVKAVPNENWQLAVRPVTVMLAVEGSDEPVESEQYGVYVSYKGTFTDEQVAENAVKHAERSQRVRDARAKAEAEKAAKATAEGASEGQTITSDDVQAVPAEVSTASAPAPDATESELTAKERVAAAREKATK